MFIGAHFLLYSADPPADRAFLRDVLRFPGVDTGEGWLICKLPPAEAGVHPLQGPLLPAAAASGASPAAGFAVATLWLMCADISATIEQLAARGVGCAPPENEGWGISSSFALPSGARLGLYQPLHATALEL